MQKMIVLLQRVSLASVTIDAAIFSSIDKGLLVFVGIENEDTIDDIIWLSNKIINLRIFDDAKQIPNLSVKDIDGDILLVSQFTLQASTKKGNRPSYIKAAKPAIAMPLYQAFIMQLETDLYKKIYTGVFGADMKVGLINDGPITIILDTKNKV